MYVHALHAVHALRDLRVAGGRLGDGVSPGITVVVLHRSGFNGQRLAISTARVHSFLTTPNQHKRARLTATRQH